MRKILIKTAAFIIIIATVPVVAILYSICSLLDIAGSRPGSHHCKS